MLLEVAIGCLEIIIIRLHGTLRVVSNLAVSFCAILDCNIVISDVYTSINTSSTAQKYITSPVMFPDLCKSCQEPCESCRTLACLPTEVELFFEYGQPEQCCNIPLQVFEILKCK